MAAKASPQDVMVSLAGGHSDRAAAYSALEASQDATLGAHCVEALLAILGKSATEWSADSGKSALHVVDAAEHRRCGLVLAHLATLDPVRIGGEFYKGMRLLSATAKGNAVDVTLSQPLEQMTKEDMRTVVVGIPITGGWTAAHVKGWNPLLDAAGIGYFEFAGAQMAPGNAYAELVLDGDKAVRVTTLVLDLLREDRAELSEAEVAGAWWTVALQGFPHEAARLHAVHAGAIGLAIAELRTGSPADWVTISKNPTGRFSSALDAIWTIAFGLATEHKHLLAATPGLMDVFMDALKEYEKVGPAEANVLAVWGAAAGLCELIGAFFAFGEVNRTVVRGAASSIRFLLDNPLVWVKDFGGTTNMCAVRAIGVHARCACEASLTLASFRCRV